MSPSEHQWSLRVYWEDTDGGGVVFFANYLKFFERARTEWLRDMGISQEQWRLQGMGFVVSDVRVRYLLPARLDEELTINTRVAEARTASFRLAQTISRDDRLLVESETRIGFIDTGTFRPRRIPNDLYALFA